MQDHKKFKKWIKIHMKNPNMVPKDLNKDYMNQLIDNQRIRNGE